MRYYDRLYYESGYVGVNDSHHIEYAHIKVVLQRSPRSPAIHDLTECHRLYDLGRHTEQP